MQISYIDGGPSFDVVDYFPHFHHQAGYVLAAEDYDAMVEYFSDEDLGLEDLDVDSPAVDTLMEDGAIHSLDDLEPGKQKSLTSSNDV